MSDLTNCFYEFGISFSLLGQAESDALGGALTRFGGVAEKVAIFTNALVCALKAADDCALSSTLTPKPPIFSPYFNIFASPTNPLTRSICTICVALRTGCRLMESACTSRSPSRTSCV